MSDIPKNQIHQAKGIIHKLLEMIPSTLSCDMFHHRPKDRHKPEDECPCVKRMTATLEEARKFAYNTEPVIRDQERLEAARDRVRSLSERNFANDPTL